MLRKSRTVISDVSRLQEYKLLERFRDLKPSRSIWTAVMIHRSSTVPKSTFFAGGSVTQRF